MLPKRTIKSLYPPALAEGEGVGTAYEYYAKRLVLRRWLKKIKPAQRILIAGLPQKYGLSFDFLLLAQEIGATAVVVDDRPDRLTFFQQSLAAYPDLAAVTPVLTADLTTLPALAPTFDLVLSSEVLQRIPAVKRADYVGRLTQLAPHVALFCPNKENNSHVGVSGLDGLTLSQLRALVATSGRRSRTGHIDMPPFPPGITRSEDQREQATSGTLEAIAMSGLGLYARAERLLPYTIRRAQSHIVYAMLS